MSENCEKNLAFMETTEVKEEGNMRLVTAKVGLIRRKSVVLKRSSTMMRQEYWDSVVAESKRSNAAQKSLLEELKNL